jgi:hypothetical protein
VWRFGSPDYSSPGSTYGNSSGPSWGIGHSANRGAGGNNTRIFLVPADGRT